MFSYNSVDFAKSEQQKKVASELWDKIQQPGITKQDKDNIILQAKLLQKQLKQKKPN